MSDKQQRDDVFAKPLAEIRAFEFNESVARVFADMISRSVPGYSLLLHLIGLYAELLVQPHSRVYDLGCSLGEASLVIADRCAGRQCRIVAVDSSPAMIDKCRQHEGSSDDIEWQCADIRDIEFADASLVVLNLTLQFLPPEERAALLQRIAGALRSGGALVLSEKVVFADEQEDRRMTALYQAFKKTMGYSELEISQKRNALENVLIPDTEAQHRERLLDAGFDEVYPCFRALNFVSWLALKA